VESTGDPLRDRAIGLVHAELDRLRAAGPEAVRALAPASPVDDERGDVTLTTRVRPEGERLMVLVEAWRGRRTLATGGFAMLPDGSAHTPD
jgi:hypothetical protein